MEGGRQGLLIAGVVFAAALGGGVSGGAPPADQRGRARTVPIDVGAYESP
jgi:hypothetical protein